MTMTTGTAGTTTRADADALAREVACQVTDPELPMLTLEDLGVLRDVEVADERVVVTITPTYSGCPAMATMRDDLVHRLRDHGFDDVEVRVSLHPAWSSDWISERGRRALTDHGLSAPGPAPSRISSMIASGLSLRGLSDVMTTLSARRVATSPMSGRLPRSRSPPQPKTQCSRPAVIARASVRTFSSASAVCA